MYVKFCLLAFSMMGYLLYYTKRYKLRLEFAPALYCAWVSNLMFAGGVLNILSEMTVLIFAGGYILLFLSLKKKFRFDKRETMYFISFLLILIWFMWRMNEAHFTSYDNFSHWATVVKDMLLVNRMPNFEDTVIRFQAYPLGSSLFIYYICKIVGTTDNCLLWAQLLMMLSFLFCTFAFVKKKRWYAGFLVLIFSIWALIANNSIYELRVDTLLPLAGIAAFAVIYYDKDSALKAIYGSSGLFILLLNIKNSGVFFYLVCVIFLTVSIWKEIGKYRWAYIGGSLVAPLLTIYLWKKHVAFAFAAGMESKHAMSIENYGQVFAKKSVSDVIQIGQAILKRLCSFDCIEIKMMFVISMLILVYLILWNRQHTKNLLQLLTADWACFAAYIVSMYAMYLFSMPLGEAVRLASYSRYVRSVLIFIYGVTIICVEDLISKGDAAEAFYFYRKKISAFCIQAIGILAVICLTAAPISYCGQRLDSLYQKPDFNQSKRYRLQKIIQTDGLQTGDSCFIYCNGTEDDARYLFYLSRYELWTSDILVVREDDFTKNKDKIMDYDYFIIWDSDKTTEQYLKERGYAQVECIQNVQKG